MSNHGVVAYAETLHHAFMKMETVEHFAKIALVTHVLGRQQPLGEQELEKLIMARVKYQGSPSASALPLPIRCNGNHNGQPQSRHHSNR
jgi:ribulose-5-phosphate 4-epimerase/fuculose-1-phosphate aldolase